MVFGMSAREIAAEIGIHENSVSRVANGNREITEQFSRAIGLLVEVKQLRSRIAAIEGAQRILQQLTTPPELFLSDKPVSSEEIGETARKLGSYALDKAKRARGQKPAKP